MRHPFTAQTHENTFVSARDRCPVQFLGMKDVL